MEKCTYFISLDVVIVRIYIFLRYILLRELFEMNQEEWSVWEYREVNKKTVFEDTSSTENILRF